MTEILMTTLLGMTALLQPPVPSSELLDPFAHRAAHSDAALAPTDLIDPFNHPPRRSADPVDCSEPALRDPFAPVNPAPTRTDATFPGLLDPFAQ